ncbi:MAG: hypothetical protein ACK4K7_16065 [Allosphingosinicella sp.]|uniref:hypothetical protein n=1 Tax=Allosphingosinicella sp. TaxID=2823234 RepID=UPI00393F5448
MAKQPTYPEEAAVGEAAEAARAAQAAAGRESKGGGGRGRHIAAGAAIGIGSAALVAALLYAKGRKNSGDKGNG